MPAIRLAVLVVVASGVVFAAPEEPKKPTPKFKLDKTVTYVTEPLDKDGYIDYEAALNERLKGKTTPETNAVVLLLKCFGPKPEGRELHPDFYKALGATAPPEKGDYLVSSGKLFADEYRGENAAAFGELETRLRRRPWKAEDSPKHAEFLKVNEKPLAAAVEASKRTGYYHPMIARKPDGGRGQLIGALLPTVQKTREIASLLSFRAMYLLAEGKTDDAFADALTMHRLGRLVARGGTLIELLVGIAIQAIAHNTEVSIFEHGKPTAKQALAYQDELLRLPAMPTALDKIRLGERFWTLDAVQSMPQTGFDGAKEFIDLPADVVLNSLDFELILRLCNTWYDRIEGILQKPTRAERAAGAAEFEKELKAQRDKVKNMTALQRFYLAGEEPEKKRAKASEMVGVTLVSLLVPAFQKVSDAADRGEQVHRNGVIAAGLAAHFADHRKYPDKLADLVPKYLAKVPDDVFTGKPLTYKPNESGYLLYGVGANGKDDGGKLVTDGAGGDDVGVRMPRQ